MENITFKEKLEKMLSENTIQGQNLKKINEHFGEENIKKLPKTSFKFITSHNRDGYNYRQIDLLTGEINEWCDVASYTTKPELTETDIKKLEEVITNLFK